MTYQEYLAQIDPVYQPRFSVMIQPEDWEYKRKDGSIALRYNNNVLRYMYDEKGRIWAIRKGKRHASCFKLAQV